MVAFELKRAVAPSETEGDGVRPVGAVDSLPGKKMTYPVERSYYRIQFPLPERPVLFVEGRQYPVLDCSEHGLRFIRSLSVPLEVGDRLSGVVRFRRGAEAEVEGEVVRVQGEHAALHLKVSGIPLSIILDEQRHLRMHYPMRF